MDSWQDRIDAAKRRVRSELSLPQWRQYGFGGPRRSEFELLPGSLPPGLANCPRPEPGLTLEQFWSEYERPGRPCMLGGIPAAEEWPAAGWQWGRLLERLGDMRFKVGKDDDGRTVSVSAADFAQYAANQQDDSPLYLFDNRFDAEKQQLLEQFQVPRYFPEDFMAAAPERPPYRWIGLGPRRSGTLMHFDPLCTSAWNTLLVGRKLWLLLPPDTPRKLAKAKAVMRKEDDDEAINHFLDLLPRLLALGDESFRPMIALQQPGDTIFVPGRWWHCVLNLDDTIAVTQNYCGRHNFQPVWRDARKERPCWSVKWLRSMPAELAAEARRLNQLDQFDMEAVRQRNRERAERRRHRRDLRALERARKEAGDRLDPEAWWDKRRAGRPRVDSSSTVSSSSSSSGSESSESSGDSSDASATCS